MPAPSRSPRGEWFCMFDDNDNRDDESLIRLVDVPDLKWMPRRRNGAKLNRSTVWRWVTAGCDGVKLEAERVGRALCTTEAKLRRFFERLAVPGSTSTTPTSKQRQKAISRAASVLAADGI